jgi:alpha-beta hydrolase superfamily lysophospholipase
VGRSRVALAAATVVAVAVAATASAPAGASPTTQELAITASDGTVLACGLVLPGGSPPAGGWPGVLLFPGLGETHAAMEAIASSYLAPAGFAALACDARGTGGSGGVFGLDGPREVQDARDLFAWLAARPEVSDTAIGAFGVSLGGGEVWNAAVAGVPFRAIVVATAWTNLRQALAPGGIPKTGLIEGLVQQAAASSWDPELAQARDDLLGGTVTKAASAALAARSSRGKLHALTVPTLMLQGRHDFLFDLDQALAAYRLVAGPKRLYLGDLGEAPAPNPAAERPHYLAEAVAWFERYLAGGPQQPGGTELAHDPWDGTTTSFPTLPPTRSVSVNLPGTTRLTHGSLRRLVRLPGGPLETFGDGSVTVRYSGASGSWDQLVASVSIKGTATSVTVGAARLTKPAGVVRVPLLDEAVLLPRGKRLVVQVGQTTAGGVYAAPAPAVDGQGSPISIARITLRLSLLRLAISG